MIPFETDLDPIHTGFAMGFWQALFIGPIAVHNGEHDAGVLRLVAISSSESCNVVWSRRTK
ncbi:MAG: hypothetical protein CMJ20_10975 [Phycisphaeraceae bacterium]|nr:hypothetical protein [Phycisphaeraceae bacterium]|tara:strand:+ start:342 stop:524 length:183 start_codon:yes stop_codon:yes gene_type:complete